jgi:hypothetical protein
MIGPFPSSLIRSAIAPMTGEVRISPAAESAMSNARLAARERLRSRSP